MIVTRKSMLSGIERSIDLPITEEQVRRWNAREGYIQEIFSNLSADEREFIMTGISAEEWDDTFKEAE